MVKFLFLVIAILILFSCSNNSNKEISADEISEKHSETKYFKITYNTVVFKENETPINILNDSILSFYNNEIDIFKKYIDDDIKDLIDSKEVTGKYELIINEEHFITSYGYISSVIELYLYTLGAHGNTTYKSICYDLENNVFVNLKDIVNIEDDIVLNKFNTLLQKHFINKDSCFSEKPIITKDFNLFSIQEDSIAIYFAPYELGAYACGSTEIVVPINELPGN